MAARLWDGALWATRHQIGVALVGCKVVRLQGSGIVLYDLSAIRSVALVWLQGSGMVLYGLPAIRSVAWCCFIQLKNPVLIISKYRAFFLFYLSLFFHPFSKFY